MSFESRYTLLDQWLHRISFATGIAQMGVADMEERLYAPKLHNIQANRPVFVTGLPRAGTTILLNLLVGAGEFASHIYRDMPFVICPMIWRRFSTLFPKNHAARERAHGDGLTISSESPEAFEEMIWKLFWKSQYKHDHIELWKDDQDEEFAVFFKSHMRKIVALRYPHSSGQHRYASKNNLNVARLNILPKILPDSTILVPFRDPLHHAASLLQQHKLFLQMHKQDPFAKRYMEGIGHFDFGQNLRPVNFDGWLDRDRRADAAAIEFWLEYWIAAYRHILGQAGGSVYLLSYASLVAHPSEALRRLASIVSLADPVSLTNQAQTLRPSREHDVDITTITPGLVDEARDLYFELQKRSTI